MDFITITIDIDRNKIELAEACLDECMPCKARISPSGHGIHVEKTGDNEELLWKLKEKYDDPTRYRLDKFRHYAGLLHNALFDNNNYEGVKKYAGEWQIINSIIDKKDFIKTPRKPRLQRKEAL